MLVRREGFSDIEDVRTVTAAAFGGVSCPEVRLVDEMRVTDAWLGRFSLVADVGGAVVGHVLGSRAVVDAVPVLALGPLSVHPDHQRRGVGKALVHTLLGAADACDEPLVVLLGDPAYYGRFGFRLAGEYGIEPPVPAWAPHFQVRTLAAYRPAIRGRFAYAEPFDRV
jgi:putative acetyltransferase